MALAALLLFLTGLVLAFGVRTLMAWVRTGDTAIRRPEATVFSPAWWGTVLFAAALLSGIAAPALALAGLVTAPAPLVHSAADWTGIGLMAGGLVLVLSSQTAMGASWRIGVDETERTALVTSGIFALVRNPVFTAMGVLLAGMVLAVPTALSVAGLAALVAAVQVQVRLIEEPYLLHTHGHAYRAYAVRTGRFLPGIGRLPGTTEDAQGNR